MIWFTSDWHLSHSKILEYDNRPYRSVEEMDDSIINNVNETLKPDDTLYYLGDFAFALNGKLDKIYEYRDRVKCRKIHFILGNHDKLIRKNAGVLIRDQVFLTITDVFDVKGVFPGVFLSHYAHRTWPGMHYPKFHAFGHSHGNLQDDPNSLSMDVGINCNGYYPVSYDKFKDAMSAKNFIPIDHHNEKTT